MRDPIAIDTATYKIECTIFKGSYKIDTKNILNPHRLKFIQNRFIKLFQKNHHKFIYDFLLYLSAFSVFFLYFLIQFQCEIK